MVLYGSWTFMVSKAVQQNINMQFITTLSQMCLFDQLSLALKGQIMVTQSLRAHILERVQARHLDIIMSIKHV